MDMLEVKKLLPELKFVAARRGSHWFGRMKAVIKSIDDFYKTMEPSLSSEPEPILIPATLLNECRSIMNCGIMKSKSNYVSNQKRKCRASWVSKERKKIGIKK